jgi:hypothetical protein
MGKVQTPNNFEYEAAIFINIHISLQEHYVSERPGLTL